MKPESNRPVTIEDLLRLKRAERPAAEFWASFDRNLRAKQLAALVEKRPWWQSRRRIFAGISRYRLPLGAGAALALALVAFRDGRVTSQGTPEQTSIESVAVATPMVETPVQAVAASEVANDEARATPVAVPAQLVAAAAPEAIEVSQVSLASQISVAGVGANVPEPIAEPPAPRYVTAKPVPARVAESVAPHSLLAVANGFEARAMPTRLAVEPLQQITPPGDSRRSRLLTAMVSTASLESSFRTTERVASRIAEERLYDQIHRFGARGDRVNVKF